MDTAQQAAQIDERKRVALEALARAGTQTGEQYDAASKGIGDLQSQALAQELASARQRNAGDAAEQEISRIISQPYTSALASLSVSKQRSRDHLYNTAVSEGSYMDKIAAQLPLIQAQLEAEMAGGGGSGGGGGGGRGGGGGGGGGDDDEYDWRKAITEDFGSTDDLRALGLRDAAKGTGDLTVPLYLRAREFAKNEYGAPDYALEELIATPKYSKGGQQRLAEMRTGGQSLAKFKKESKKVARETPGNQKVQRNYLVSQARAVLPTKAQVRAKKKAANAQKKGKR